jgi:hypothetical protein
MEKGDRMSVIPNPLPSSELLHEYLRYDDVHGHLYWRPRPKSRDQFAWNASFAMRRADGEMQNGYARVRFAIDGKLHTFQAHRVIWKMVYGYDPYPEIDHIDRDRLNNRHFNLRIATRDQNATNRSSRRQKIGRGVYPTKSGKFTAQVRIARKCIYLGTYNTAEAALAAVAVASSPLPQ